MDGEESPAETCRALVDELTPTDLDPQIGAVLESLLSVTDQLQQRVTELEAELTKTHNIATTASGNAAENTATINTLKDDHEKTRDITRTAVAKAQQLEVDPDQQEDAERLPADVAPGSSPPDFFANCRERKCTELFAEAANRQNTYRAITVAKRWPEFGTERTDGSGVFFIKEDVTVALTADLGTNPHRQAVAHVWDTLIELGGTDVQVKPRQVGRQQTPTELLVLDKATAEGFLEERYLGLELLETTTVEVGGFTLVVTGETERPCDSGENETEWSLNTGDSVRRRVGGLTLSSVGSTSSRERLFGTELIPE